VPVRRDNPTTVRVRTKNNSYVYGQQNINGMQMIIDVDPDQQNMLWQRKREIQEKIQKFKEFKLQRQIEEIEAQQQELKNKLDRDRAMEIARRKRNETLKVELGKYENKKREEEKAKKQLEADEMKKNNNRETLR